MVSQDNQNPNAAVYDEFVKIRNLLDPNFYANQIQGALRIKECIDVIDNFSSNAKIKHVLSLGCGTGEIEMLLAFMLPEIKSIHCVDDSEESLNKIVFYKNLNQLTIEVIGNFSDGFQIKIGDGQSIQDYNFLQKIAEWQLNETINHLDVTDTQDEKVAELKRLMQEEQQKEEKDEQQDTVADNDPASLLQEYMILKFNRFAENLKKKCQEENASIDQFFEEPTNIKEIDLEHSLLLIAGHTIPHFLNWDMMKGTIIKDKLPKYFLLDFHENFDTALDALRKNDSFGYHFLIKNQCLQTDKCRATEKCVYGLLTKRISNNTEHIHRGIGFTNYKNNNCELITNKEGPKTEDNNYFLPVCTTQLNKKSGEFIKDCVDMGYIAIQEFDYINGYGHMNATLMIRTLQDAKVANDAYRKHLGQLIKDNLFEDKSTERLKEDVASAFSFFEKILIGAIKPFDSYLTFAEYIRMVERMPSIINTDNYGKRSVQIYCNQCKDAQKPGNNAFQTRKEMLLTPFDYMQTYYPTADGLYFSLLAEPGCGFIVPPALIPEKKYNMCKIDFEFWKIEKILMLHNDNFFSPSQSLQQKCLEVFGQFTIAEGSKKEDKEDRVKIKEESLLCIPVYYGGLPLIFVLASPKNINLLTTSKDMVEELCRNLGQNIRKYITTDLSLGKLFFELAKAIDTTDYKEEELTALVEKLLENAKSKPWKNWLDTFPEIDIRHKKNVQEEHDNLKKIVADQVKNLKRDARWNISHIFNNNEFFKNDGQTDNHTGYNLDPQNGHPPKCEPIRKSIINEILTETATDNTAKKISEQIKKWTLNKLEEIKTNNSDASKSFKLLKAFFCRQKDQSYFRFSIKEIEAIIAILFPCFTFNNQIDSGGFNENARLAVMPHATIWRDDIMRFFCLLFRFSAKTTAYKNSARKISLTQTPEEVQPSQNITTFILFFEFPTITKKSDGGDEQELIFSYYKRLLPNTSKATEETINEIKNFYLKWKIEYTITSSDESDESDKYLDGKLIDDFWIECGGGDNVK